MFRDVPFILVVWTALETDASSACLASYRDRQALPFPSDSRPQTQCNARHVGNILSARTGTEAAGTPRSMAPRRAVFPTSVPSLSTSEAISGHQLHRSTALPPAALSCPGIAAAHWIGGFCAALPSEPWRLSGRPFVPASQQKVAAACLSALVEIRVKFVARAMRLLAP